MPKNGQNSPGLIDKQIATPEHEQTKLLRKMISSKNSDDLKNYNNFRRKLNKKKKTEEKSIFSRFD